MHHTFGNLVAYLHISNSMSYVENGPRCNLPEPGSLYVYVYVYDLRLIISKPDSTLTAHTSISIITNFSNSLPLQLHLQYKIIGCITEPILSGT